MYELPITVTVGNKEYAIRDKADYRTILAALSLGEDPEMTPKERTVSALIVFYDGIDSLEDLMEEFPDNINEAVDAMSTFLACGETSGVAHHNTVKLIDWEQDEQLIISAVNNVARTEIRALPYLHWWTFMSYYMAIGECALSNVVGIRNKIAKGKKLEKYEREFKNENPQYFVWKKDKEEEQNLLKNIWNKGKK